MFKAGTLLLTACLVSASAFAQEDPKPTKQSDAVVTQLKEDLAKAQTALKARLEEEAVARAEAEKQRERAEAALKAAEAERAKALKAQEEAEKLRAVAEQQRVEALKQAELARAAEIAAKEAAIAALEQEKKRAAAKQPQPERGAKRKAKVAALEQQVETLTEKMEQMQAELNALKAQLKQGQAKPGLKPGLGGKTEFNKGGDDLQPQLNKAEVRDRLIKKGFLPKGECENQKQSDAPRRVVR